MEDQDALRRDVKLWLKAKGRGYAWLAQKCFVTESTVRNWMARKTIPAAKVYIIHDLMRQSAACPSTPQVEVHSEAVVTVRLDEATANRLETLASSHGQSTAEFLDQALRNLGGGR